MSTVKESFGPNKGAGITSIGSESNFFDRLFLVKKESAGVIHSLNIVWIGEDQRGTERDSVYRNYIEYIQPHDNAKLKKQCGIVIERGSYYPESIKLTNSVEVNVGNTTRFFMDEEFPLLAEKKAADYGTMHELETLLNNSQTYGQKAAMFEKHAALSKVR